MFGPCKFLLADDIGINEVDLVAERRPAANRLYEEAVEKIARREENKKLKHIEDLRAELKPLAEKPGMQPNSRALAGRIDHGPSFYEYNQDWIKKREANLKKQRDELEAKRLLEAAERKLALKEHYEKYRQDLEKIEAYRTSQRSKSPLTGEGKKCPPPPPAPSNFEFMLSFQACNL